MPIFPSVSISSIETFSLTLKSVKHQEPLCTGLGHNAEIKIKFFFYRKNTCFLVLFLQIKVNKCICKHVLYIYIHVPVGKLLWKECSKHSPIAFHSKAKRIAIDSQRRYSKEFRVRYIYLVPVLLLYCMINFLNRTLWVLNLV